MKKWIVSLAVIGALVAIVVPSFADDATDIRGLYDKICAAMKAKDADAIMKLGSKDFTMAEKGGKPQNGKAVTAELKKQFMMIKSVDECTAEISEIKISGKTAKAKSKMHSIMMMPMGKDKMGKMEDWENTSDSFVKTSEGWKFKTIVSTGSKILMDGKPYDPTKKVAKPAEGKGKK